MVTALRRWSVAGGIVVNEADQLLLVKNRRRHGVIDWSTPGGVIDAGEAIIEGLTREVAEETGLRVEVWAGPLYRIEVTAPDLGFFLEVEAHRAVVFSGEVVVDDPDGIVVDAAFHAIEQARVRLTSSPPWVAEPLLDYLEHPITDGRLYAYRIDGADPLTRRVTRL